MFGVVTSASRGDAPANFALARRASWRQVPTGLPTVSAISSNGIWNTS